MRIIHIIGILLILVSLALSACSSPVFSPTVPQSQSSPTPTQQTPTISIAPIPTPQFTTPGTGAIIGQVMFPDGSPAYRTIVYIFKEEETSSFASCYVDMNGYYMFDELPSGRYSIYTASYGRVWGFSAEPKAILIVAEKVTTNAPTLTQSGNIIILLDNPRIAGIPGEDYTSKNIIDGHNPKLTWESIQNASYYTVTIWSSGDYNEDYKEIQKVTNNTIVWSTNLSALPYQEFVVDVEAYTNDDVLIASGREWFAVDNPPDGWVFK